MDERTNRKSVFSRPLPLLTENGLAVTIAVREGENEVARITLETPELEAFIHELADLRAKMADPVPQEIDVGARIQAIVCPRWDVKIPSQTASPSVVLCLRHPGNGWIANLFQVADARNLARRLLQVAAEQSSDDRSH